MKTSFFPALVLCLCFCACKKPTESDVGAKSVVIRVGASAVPHTPILQIAAEVLKRENVTLKIVTFNDYVQPNLRLSQGDIEANYYQTQPYLDFFNAQHNLTLTSLGRVHIEPFGLYSRKYKSLDALPEGAWVAIPNEISNGHRALELLAHAGLIKFNPVKGLAGGVKDITENTRHLRFKEVEAAMIPRILEDVDVAGINTNFALGAGFSPAKDALALETANSPYANILVVRAQDVQRAELQKLLQALHGPEVKKFIEQQYHGNVLSVP